MSAQAALGYRRPMAVLELARHGSGGLFPLCPRCGSAMEREYQAFCDRCGHRLRAGAVFAGRGSQTEHKAGPHRSEALPLPIFPPGPA